MSIEKNVSENESKHGHSVLFARLAWAMIGPCVLLAAAVQAAKSPHWLTLWEGVYLLAIVMMIGGRYVEQKSGHGTTLYSEPSTWGHFRAFALKTLVFSVAFWIVARSSGMYFL